MLGCLLIMVHAGYWSILVISLAFAPPSLGLFLNLFCTHNVCMISSMSELKHSERRLCHDAGDLYTWRPSSSWRRTIRVWRWCLSHRCPVLSPFVQLCPPGPWSYPLVAPGCSLIHAGLVGFMAQEVTSLIKTAAPQYPLSLSLWWFNSSQVENIWFFSWVL